MRVNFVAAASIVFVGALLSAAAPAQAMEQLFVKLTPDSTRPYNGWNGAARPDSSFVYRTLTIEFSPADSVENLKTRVQDQIGLPQDQLLLTFEDRLLGDNETVESAGIPKETTLKLLLPTGTMSAVPEPGQWGLMIAGLGLVGWQLRGRRSFRAAASLLSTPV